MLETVVLAAVSLVTWVAQATEGGGAPSAAALAVIAGALLSAAGEYLPGFSAWFQRQDKIGKRLVMAGFSLLGALLIYLFSCYGQLPAGIQPMVCDQAGLWSLFWSFVYTFGTNQLSYIALPGGNARKQVEQERAAKQLPTAGGNV